MGRKWSVAGFGIIEMMVVMSLMLIMFGGIISMQIQTSQATLSSQQSLESTFLHSELYSALKDPTACGARLGPYSVSNLTGFYSNRPRIFRKIS